MPVDAESWLASRGVQREPLRVTPTDASGSAGDPALVPVEADLASPASLGQEVPAGRELADQDASTPLPDMPEETVEGALGFIRRSTSNAPQSEGRLRAKLADRGYPEPIVEEAMGLARAERLVDDAAMIAALIIERRARGHADLRLRRDLRGRGFSGAQVDEALAQFAATDPAAAVFAIAREQAARHRAVDAEAAVRRTVGFLVRRGHGEGIARKAARDAVYADREAQQVAER